MDNLYCSTWYAVLASGFCLLVGIKWIYTKKYDSDKAFIGILFWVISDLFLQIWELQ